MKFISAQISTAGRRLAPNNMQNKFKLFVFPLLVVPLLLGEALFFMNKSSLVVVILRELLSCAVVLSTIPLIKCLKCLSDKELMLKLKSLFFVFTSIYLLVIFLNAVFKPFSYILQFTGAYHTDLFASPGAFVTGLTLALGISVFLLASLLVIRDLILNKHKKLVARIFGLSMFFLALLVVLKFIEASFIATKSNSIAISNKILWILFIISAALNAFRNSWVNLLNKRNKLRCVFWGMPVVAGAILFVIFIARIDLIRQYSQSLAIFLEASGLFVSIYVGAAFLSLLLHLPTATLYDRRREEVRSFQDLSRILPAITEPQQILKTIAAKAKEITKADAIWFSIRDKLSDKLRIVTSEGSTDNKFTLSEDMSISLSESLMKTKESLLINEVAVDPRCSSDEILKAKFGSLLGIPTIVRDRVSGILYAGKRETYAFEDEERYLLEAFAHQAAIAMENARLINALLEKERFEQELRIAREAQQKLIPMKMPHVAGLSIDAITLTANEVGGDYFNFFEVDGKLGIVIGDVSGKGAQAAFYMAELKGIIESVASIYSSPKELMIHVNNTLCDSLDKQSFVTLVYALLDIKKKSVVLARAGHNPPLLLTKREKVPVFLEPLGLGLGFDNSQTFSEGMTEQKIQLHSGDLLIFYTDGVTEAMNSKRIEFGEDRLRDLLANNFELSATDMKKLLVKELTKFVGQPNRHDDLTLVVLKME